MFEDMLQDTWAYQEILEKGLLPIIDKIFETKTKKDARKVLDEVKAPNEQAPSQVVYDGRRGWNNTHLTRNPLHCLLAGSLRQQ